MKVSGVSYSSDRKLSRCEQQYSYRYDQKLKPKVKKKGLFTGDWMHQLEEAYRRHLLQKNPTTWKEVLTRLVEDVWDKLFEEEQDMYSEGFPMPFLDYVESLMTHYEETWKPTDSKWKVLEIEKFYQLKTKAGFLIRWKSDFVAKDGKFNVLVETKNKKKIPDSEERIMAPQTHGYCFLLKQVGIKIDKIIWDYVRTAPVPKPELTKKGAISQRKINTDQRQFMAFMKESGHQMTPELQRHINALPATLTLKRVTNTPNLKLGELFVRDWIERARRAREIKRPLRTFTSNCKWDCDYFSLCQVDMLGLSDREMEIKKNFVRIGDIKNVD